MVSCERFKETNHPELQSMLGTLPETQEKVDWKAHLSSMTHALYNCTQHHSSTTYSLYFLMFGRQPRLPIDFEVRFSY